MDTSLVNVDLNPEYVRIEIKGKITQLKFDEEILVDKSKTQRSTITGALVITMPRANLTELEARNLKLKQKQSEKQVEDKLKALDKAQEESKQEAKKRDQER